MRGAVWTSTIVSLKILVQGDMMLHEDALETLGEENVQSAINVS